MEKRRRVSLQGPSAFCRNPMSQISWKGFWVLAVCSGAWCPVLGQLRVIAPSRHMAGISRALVTYRSETLQSVAGTVILTDGRTLVLDPASACIEVFDPSGHVSGHIGRRGAGPGEFSEPAGMTAALDGRVFVWDPGNNRVTVFAPSLKASQGWHLQALAFGGVSPMWFNDDGTVSVSGYLRRSGARPNPELPNGGVPPAIIRLSEQGTAVDTTWLPPPVASSYVFARHGRSQRRYPIPFVPAVHAVWNPRGILVSSAADRYELTLARAGGRAVVITVQDEPIPVGEEEGRDWARSINAFMHAVDPFWQAPRSMIPAKKAPVRDLWSAADGRIWVRVPQPAQRIGSAAIPNTADRILAFDNWREPNAYDVFEATGRHLGRLRLPGTSLGTPVYARGDTVILLSYDRDDLPVLSKHSITWPPR